MSKQFNTTNAIIPNIKTSKYISRAKALLGIATLVSFASITPSFATVYKVVEPDGSVLYTDNPQNHQDSVSVEPLAISVSTSNRSLSSSSTSNSNSINRSATSSTASNNNSSSSSDSSRNQTNNQNDSTAVVNYRLEIITPEQERVYHKPAQEVEIELATSPALRGGDTLQILVDGTQVGEGATASVPTIDMLPGEHTITVQIVSPTSGVIKSEEMLFYVIQSTAIFRQRQEMQDRLNAYNELSWPTKLYLHLRQNELHPVERQSRTSDAFSNGTTSSAF